MTTWPHIAPQWQSDVYAERLRTSLARIDLDLANRGLGRWVDDWNKAPTVLGLLGAIDQVADEERRAAYRKHDDKMPTPEQVAVHSPPHRAAEDRAIAKEALAMINGLLNNRLTMAQCVDRCHKLALEASTPELGQYWANYAERLQR